MDVFLRGLLLELARRCGVIRERLKAASEEPDVRDYALAAYVELGRVRKRIQAMLADPSLGNAALVGNQLRSYRRHHEQVQFIESFPLPFVERYGEHDRRLTRFCRRIAAEAGWQLLPPLVSASSTQYYWTMPAFSLIAVPAAEATTLLGLPDLGHELGHILVHEHRGELVGDFIYVDFLSYIDAEKRRAVAQQRPQDYIKLFDRLFGQWEEEWLTEFVSDMIAAYLLGPAFGYQHLRLCAGSGNQAYHPALGESGAHPADEARMRGIIAALEVLGEDTAQLKERWSGYLRASKERRPAEYAACYPQQLVVQLAKRVVEGCRELGLRSAAEQEAGSIAALLNEAWEKFFAAPEGYSAWEKERLEAVL